MARIPTGKRYPRHYNRYQRFEKGVAGVAGVAGADGAKNTITSDHGGFAGAKLPENAPAPVKIFSSENSCPARCSSPVNRPSPEKASPSAMM